MSSLQVINGPSIKAGESLSDGADCTSGTLVRLTMPADWTRANLTFQISSDGTFYNNFVNYRGEEISIGSLPAGACVLLPSDLLGPLVQFLKIRSGTSTHPVPQQGDRSFAVAVEVEAA